ncbi:sortase [Rothia nasimurium]|uniref:Sortase n=1 Tax=Rothia nasimurium TaxID=85336 RepID=A0A4Y9F081_9MICC|nr:sortase [Rothia nasimurium]MBF0809336.1 sortase [Rothia nasimurium]TFU19889.1 sortase [Rothia nasimurium]
MTQKKTMTATVGSGRKVRAVVAALAAALVLIVGLVLAGGFFSGWVIKDGQVYAPYQLRHPDATGEVFEQDGQEYYEPVYGFMAENTDPTAGFSTPPVLNLTPTPVQCTGEALGEVVPEPGSWVVPSLSDGAGGVARGYFAEGLFSDGIPSAPGGVLSALSAPLGTQGKASVLAGHVNMDFPDDRLSSWGLLHYIDACAHVYITDEAGVTREYQVAVIDTIGQGETETDPSLWGSAEATPDEWAKYGADELVWLLTCSGTFVGDSGEGNTFLFPYTDNLRVGLVPVGS